MYGTDRKNNFSPQIQYFSYTKKCWGFCGEGGREEGGAERREKFDFCEISQRTEEKEYLHLLLFPCTAVAVSHLIR